MFESIYLWFEALFGRNLESYLKGDVCENEAADVVSGSNQFIIFGILSLILALVFVIMYYYVINHPRFNRWWSWLTVLLVGGVINLFIGFGWTSYSLSNGCIGDCLLYNLQDDPDKQNRLIGNMDCWGFGIDNFIVSVMFFIALSFILKWWSRNCKRSPF
jgi:hypothetical protein